MQEALLNPGFIFVGIALLRRGPVLAARGKKSIGLSIRCSQNHCL